MLEFGSRTFVRRRLAFYGFVPSFTAIEAQVVIHAVLPFHEGKMSAFLERGASADNIYLRIWSFLSGDFMDSGIVISVAWWAFIGISWSRIKSPIAIKVSSFFDCGCKCSGLRSQKSHLLIEGAVEIVVEGKHLGSIIDVRSSGVLAPFLVPLIELSVPHLAGVHLGNGLYLCFRGYELLLKGCLKISPCSVVDRVLAQGSGHEVACPFSGLCSLFEVGEGRGNLCTVSCVDGHINVVVVLKRVPKGEGPVGLAFEGFGWRPEEFRVDLGHDGYCRYRCSCLGRCS